jgi:hypothetical protein
MGQDWKIRIQPAERIPYEFKATLLLRSAGDASALDVSYLYGDGDPRFSSRTWARRRPRSAA